MKGAALACSRMYFLVGGLQRHTDPSALVLLHHQIEHPFATPLFRFAIFISGTAPLSRTEEFGWDVTNDYRNVDLGHYLGKNGTTRVTLEEDPKRSRLLTNGASNSHNAVEEAGKLSVRWWMPNVDRERIQIPTAHVYGAKGKDHWLDQSIILENMCEPSLRHRYQHGGAHEVPLRMAETKKAAEIIQKAVVASELTGGA
ncbi:MAG: hypothetical protein Q9227_003196 [Pyrenula ochraceoflavens]